MTSSIEQKIKDLRAQLHQYNYNYYVLDAPTISDYEFDLKLKELEKLEAENARKNTELASYAMQMTQKNEILYMNTYYKGP